MADGDLCRVEETYIYKVASLYLAVCITQITLENRRLMQKPNQALVPENIAPGTRETFSPGWSHQLGLKVDLYSWLVAPTRSKAFVPASGVARDWKVTFSPGWIHQLGL